ncbi:hypothetical protein BACT_0855 [Bifidobacterium actinocoloniiforme DSM 22766]|uniref:Uncharacterized protein n=1 Tax=Bifidobacterium actinocoloniiforme DSM 22766 TaxID=1437605 RepID=A0A086Z0V3_9BIFI|nr:hypothetical protein [Bifidobacterium actinocoloniiforme]AKV55345.1 hypothetical protein AB656_02880 [Bifidobacterium actinocoloniiforme DSM 22766]KFI40153.1 hypothetical protein BACT_0855 [Bifidobacterium actinocoloniiforme DSM 22766]
MSKRDRLDGFSGLFRPALALLCSLALLGGLAGCAPRDRAVGDSWRQGVSAEHDGPDRSAVLVAVIGPANAERDSRWQDLSRRLFQSLERAGMHAYYAPAWDQAGQEQGVRDAVARRVSLIAVERPGAGDWSRSLILARNKGVPVVVLDGGQEPGDTTLYAARVDIDEGSPSARPLPSVLQTIADDRQHARRLVANLNDEPTQRTSPDQMEAKQ